MATRENDAGARGSPGAAQAALLLPLVLVAALLHGGVEPPVRAGLQLAVAALAAWSLAAGALAPVPRSALGVALLWSALALVSTLWSVEPDATLDAAAGVLAAALVFLLAAGLLNAPRRDRFLLQLSLAGAACAVLAIGLAPEGGRAHAPFVSPNHLGTWLLLPGGVALARLTFSEPRRRGEREAALLWFGLLVATLAGLAASESRGAALAAAAAAAGLLVLRRGRAALAAGALAGGAAALILLPPLAPDLLALGTGAGESSAGLRWKVYGAAARAAFEAAPLGVGIGGFAPAFEAYRPAGLPYAVRFAHSEPLHALVELGLPFLLAAGLCAVLALRTASRGLRAGAPPAALCGATPLLALLAHALIDFPLHVPALALAGATLAGLTWRALSTASARTTPRLTHICVGSLALLLAALSTTQAVALGAAARAREHLARGEFAAAERALARGLRARPARAGLLALRADAAEGAYRFGGGGRDALARALAARARARAVAPCRTRHRLELARSRALAGDAEGALREAALASELDPLGPAARLEEARRLLALEREARAAAAVRDAIERHPDASHELLGALLRARGDAALLRAAVPDLPEPRRRAGRLLLHEGHVRAAADELERAAALAPDDADVALEAAAALDRVADRAAARAVLERALARSPHEQRLAAALARLAAPDGVPVRGGPST